MKIQILIMAIACGAITAYITTRILVGRLLKKLETLEVEHRKALLDIVEKLIHK